MRDEGTNAPTHIRIYIMIPNRIKSEIPIETRYPSSQGVQKFRQRRMNVKVILSSEVLTCKGAKVDFVEAGVWKEEGW
jgi:hypothetical protein